MHKSSGLWAVGCLLVLGGRPSLARPPPLSLPLPVDISVTEAWWGQSGKVPLIIILARSLARSEGSLASGSCRSS